EIAQLCFFLSDTVYKWPNSQILASMRAQEEALATPASLDGFDNVVGWGTGSLFRSTYRLLDRPLVFLVDSEKAKWDSLAEGIPVKPPAALRELDPAHTAIVVFSCFFDEI